MQHISPSSVLSSPPHCSSPADLSADPVHPEQLAPQPCSPLVTNLAEDDTAHSLPRSPQTACTRHVPPLAETNSTLWPRNLTGHQHDDGGLGVVRIKPLGAGGGGVEASASGGVTPSVYVAPNGGVGVTCKASEKHFSYPRHVMDSETTQDRLYSTFMPHRVEAFLSGVNVNMMAYGQTGSGKTHTMFGPPGIMAAAATGQFGTSVIQDYGLCPRALLDIYHRVQQARASGTRCVLTASAVELTFAEGSLDMFVKAEERAATRFQRGLEAVTTVSLDRATKPPRLYGMIEVPLETDGDLLKLFSAISVRNTSGTGMNDSSSRSHCFVFLTLRALDAATGMLRTSRFQFVDLAGSERQDTAHGGLSILSGNLAAWEGMATNYSLMMLSRCIRDLVASRKSKGHFSFRSYLVDLVQLLMESLTGRASTLVIVCCSAAPANGPNSSAALEFGEVFSRLRVRPPSSVTGKPIADVRKQAIRGLREAEDAGATKGKFAQIRRNQANDCRQLLGLLDRLEG